LLIIKRKKNESIGRMVKRYKRKHRDTKIKRKVRENKHYTKKSTERRNEILSAKYRLEKFGDDN